MIVFFSGHKFRPSKCRHVREGGTLQWNYHRESSRVTALTTLYERVVLSNAQGFRGARISWPVVCCPTLTIQSINCEKGDNLWFGGRRMEVGFGAIFPLSLTLTPPIFASFDTYVHTYKYVPRFDLRNPLFYFLDKNKYPPVWWEKFHRNMVRRNLWQ